MENRPFLSIVMPVYNAEKYLLEIFSSILGQTYENWELIVVNDCSTDSSRKICDEFSYQDKRIKVIHLSENKGAGNARNVGIQESKGEYITFVDADDAIDLKLYEKAVKAVKTYSVDVVVWGLIEEYYNKKMYLCQRIRFLCQDNIVKIKNLLNGLYCFLSKNSSWISME